MNFNIYGETGDAGIDHANAVMDAALDELTEPVPWTELLGAPSGHVTITGAAEATRKVIEQAQIQRKPPPEVQVLPPDADEEETDDPVEAVFDALFATAATGGGHWAEILGADAGTVEINGEDANPGLFQSPVELPVTERLYRHFAAAAPAPQLVRVDTEASYADFISRRAFDELARHVDDLEAAFEEHVSDGHGGGPERFRELVEIIGAGKTKGAAGALNEIPLSLPPYCAGKVFCWREGNTICCSLCLPGPDGEVRVATAARPAAESLQEVVGYVHDAGIDPMEILGVLPTLADMLGAGGLIPQIARAAPGLLADPEAKAGQPYLRKIVPTNDRTIATAIALCQLAEGGNVQAKAEWERLAEVARTPAGAPLAAVMAEAVRRFGAARKHRS